MSTRQISLSQFATRCQDEIAMAQREHTILEIVGIDGPVAMLSPLPVQTTGTIADWMGSGVGFSLAEGTSLDDPAFEPGEWEDFVAGDKS